MKYMQRIEFKYQTLSDWTFWGDKMSMVTYVPSDATASEIDSHVRQVVDGITPLSHVAEIRWNYTGSTQGHYIAVDYRPL